PAADRRHDAEHRDHHEARDRGAALAEQRAIGADLLLVALGLERSDHRALRRLALHGYSLYCLSFSVNVRIGISISCAARVLTPPAAASASAIRRRPSSRISSAIGRNALGAAAASSEGTCVASGGAPAPPSRSGRSDGSTLSSGAAAMTYSIVFLSSRTLPGHEWVRSTCIAAGVTVIAARFWRAQASARNARASNGTSHVRSRSG